ncbi:hypothetical protein DFJ77DRAFT_550429 [Powellomyces hirtus]|nr:hypothetical protein DFJ77DRAFT_550429 [Powellomyces hirtus]
MKGQVVLLIFFSPPSHICQDSIRTQQDSPLCSSNSSAHRNGPPNCRPPCRSRGPFRHYLRNRRACRISRGARRMLELLQALSVQMSERHVPGQTGTRRKLARRTHEYLLHGILLRQAMHYLADGQDGLCGLRSCGRL